MLPLPTPSSMTQPFWDGVQREQLLVQECNSCGLRTFPPEPLCAHCGAGELAWRASPGVGTVYTCSLVHQAIDPDQPVPFVLAAVDLDDGWTMLTHVVGVDPGLVEIGMRVRFAPTLRHGGFLVPTFTPLR